MEVIKPTVVSVSASNIGEIMTWSVPAERNSFDVDDFLSSLGGATEYAAQIDDLGRKSAAAQQLSSPITSWEKIHGSNHTVILLCAPQSSGKEVIGFIKYGTKDLYFYRKNGAVVSRPDTFCLLDFFVSSQRKGYGKILFDAMLKVSNDYL